MRGIRPNLCWCTSIEDSNKVESAGAEKSSFLVWVLEVVNSCLRFVLQYLARQTSRVRGG